MSWGSPWAALSGGTYPQVVNRVEAPYPGLPAGTVAMIENGEGFVLVYWVRVTRPADTP